MGRVLSAKSMAGLRSFEEGRDAPALPHDEASGKTRKYAQLQDEEVLKESAPSLPSNAEEEQLHHEGCWSSTKATVSYIFMSHMNPLFRIGFGRPLEMDDLPQAQQKMVPPAASAPLKASWSQLQSEGKLSLFHALARAHGRQVIVAIVAKLLPEMMAFVGPLFLQAVISFIDPNESDESEVTWENAARIVIALFSCNFVGSVIGKHIELNMHYQTNVLKTGLRMLVYDKMLLLNNEARQTDECSAGKIVNMMQVDVDKVGHIVWSWSAMLSLPVKLLVAMVLLFRLAGCYSRAAVAVMLLLTPLNYYMTNGLKTYEKEGNKHKDERVRIISEKLNGVRVLKLFAWEDVAMQEIQVERTKEVEANKKKRLRVAMLVVYWSTAGALMAAAIFTAFTVLGKQALTLNIVLGVYALMGIVQHPFAAFPWLMLDVVSYKASLKRLQDFLLADELQDYREHKQVRELGSTLPTPDQKQLAAGGLDAVLELSESSFRWESGTDLLKNISMEVQKGQLVAVVGPVGSGKSSLLAALMGEMQKSSGKVSVQGNCRIGYVPQQAWIVNKSVRDNILMGNEYDCAKYRSVIQAAALQDDINLLPAKDFTEIGEKGVNLSGGQKQRIGLARALYSNSQVMLLDDPLSAVDGKVAKHLFEHCILSQARERTQILVTHRLEFISKVDHIFVMKDGRIVAQGAFEAVEDHVLELGYDCQATSDNIGQLAQPIKKQGPELKQEMGDDDGNLTVEEQRERGQVKRETWMIYLRAAGRSTAVMLVGVAAIIELSGIFSNWLLSSWASQKASESKHSLSSDDDDSDQSLFIMLGSYVALSALKAFAVLAKEMGMTYAGLKASTVMHNRMLAAVFRSPLSFFDTTPTGRILNRFSQDTNAADQNLPYEVGNLLTGVVGCVLPMAWTLISVPLSSIAIAPISVLYLVTLDYFRRTMRELKRLESTAGSPFMAHLTESIEGLPCIRAFCLSSEFSKECERKLAEKTRVFWPIMQCYMWLNIRLELCGNLLVTGTTMCALWLRLQGPVSDLQAASIALSVTICIGFTGHLSHLCHCLTNAENNMNKVERMQEYAALEPEAPIETVKDQSLDAQWPSSGSIEFKDVQFRYREGTPLILKGVNLKIQGGHKIGICGRTGSGKSTLISSIFRLSELDGGVILLDGADISQLGLKTLRSSLTIVPQDPVLYNGTFRYNLDPSQKKSDSELWEALKAVNLSSKVTDLDCSVGEGAQSLSVGERQLMCMARALTRRSKVIVLDEATAAVDMATDALIQNAIREGFKGQTVLTIAHRLNTVMDYDRICVMGDGKVLEYGSPAGLSQKPDSVFAELLAHHP